MKTTLKTKKLLLQRDTVKALGENELHEVKGAVTSYITTVTLILRCLEPSGGPFCWTGS